MCKTLYLDAGKKPLTSYFWYLICKKTADPTVDIVFRDYQLLNGKWGLVNEVLLIMGQDPFAALDLEVLKKCHKFTEKLGW